MTATSAPTALITGGSRGIGLGIATSLAAKGWSLTLAARDLSALEDVRTRLVQGGAIVQVVAGDVASDDDLEVVVQRHEQAYGSMNALILAAGVGSAGAIAGYAARRLDKQVAVNFRAPFVLVSRALEMLRAGARLDASRASRVIALSSMEGVYPEAGLAAYGATKAALISLIRSVNTEESDHGVLATAISPGFVDTDMSAWVADRIAPESMIQVDDIVKVVELVLSLSPAAVVPHLIVNRTGGGAYTA